MQLSLILLAIFAAISTVDLRTIHQAAQGNRGLNFLKSSKSLLQNTRQNVRPWSPKSCSLALQGIADAPESGLENYFDSVFKYFELNRELMFLAPQNVSVVYNFLATYRINVTVYDALGINGLGFILPVGTVTDEEPIQYPNTIRASINLPRFVNGGDGRAYYTRIIRNHGGELKYITLSLNLANAPQFCV